MILAGIWGNQHIQSERLRKSIQSRIVGDGVFFQKDLVQVIAGKTSALISQGEVLRSRNNLLIGKVFKKSNFQPITQEDVEKEVTGKFFVDEYWGNYLFFNTSDKEMTIIRDPVGQLPLFYTLLHTGEILFSSELETLCRLMGFKPSFNWSYLASYLMRSQFITSQTPFESIFELPQGCQVVFDSDGSSSSPSVAWNPLNYIHNEENSTNIQKKIVETSTNVIRSWVKDADGVCLDFSGGTDSTAILFMLNSVLAKHQPLRLINLYHPEILSSDERRYALAAADEVGRELLTFDVSKSPLPFESIEISENPKPNWPNPTLMHLAERDKVEKLSEDLLDTVYVSGHGGDSAFISSPRAETLCDYIIERGTEGLYAKIKELASMSREPLIVSAVSIIKGMMGYYGFSQPSIMKRKHMAPWFTKDLLELEKIVPYHPFFYEKNNLEILPGKLKLVESIYRGLATTRDVRNNGTNFVFYPLFSQPVLELALSIPGYDSFQGGYSRYHFRRAISGSFKTNLVWRKDKGKTSGILQKNLKKKENRLLELCLEGKMIRTGLLDKEALKQNLRGMLCGHAGDDWPITDLACLEIFLEYWNSID